MDRSELRPGPYFQFGPPASSVSYIRTPPARHRLSARDAKFFDLSASFVARGIGKRLPLSSHRAIAELGCSRASPLSPAGPITVFASSFFDSHDGIESDKRLV